MVDTQRFKLGAVCVQLVSEVAATLARRDPEHLVHVLQLATYLPLDVQSVTRILESLEDSEEPGVERVQHDSLSWLKFDAPEHFIRHDLDLDAGEHLAEEYGLMRTINALKSDPDWERKMREEHQLLKIAAAAKHRTVELAYLTRRMELPSAKIQSILNDFHAEGHIGMSYDDDTSTLSYTFPKFDYPPARFERNMSMQAQAEPDKPANSRWAVVGLAMLGLVLIILLIRLAL